MAPFAGLLRDLKLRVHGSRPGRARPENDDAASLEVIAVSGSAQPLPGPGQDDRVDLDDLFRDAKPIGDGASLAAPGVFETQEERDEFLSWLRADRAAGVA